MPRSDDLHWAVDRGSLEVLVSAPEPKGTAVTKDHPKLRAAKRIVVAVVGGTVTLVGIALIVLPGPAFIVIPLGLSILATEFVWARRYVEKARQFVKGLKSKV